MASLSILKEEAINAHINVVKLQANTFSDHLDQSVNSLDLMFNSQATLWSLHQNKESLHKQFVALLKNTPHIRSINLLENNRVVLSSNPNNLNVSIELSNFYPKPFFNQSVLRIGSVFQGRDLNELTLNDPAASAFSNTLNFIPIIKKIQFNNKSYHLLVALNPDYFLNKYLSNVEPFTHIDILRLDDTILASTNNKTNWLNTIKTNSVLSEAKERNSASGIASFENEEYIVAYSLSKNFPLNIAVRTHAKECLKGWENKRYDFFIITTLIVVICIFLVLFLLFLYTKAYTKEIQRHKEQIKNDKKFRVLFESKHFISAIIQKDGSIKELNQKALSILNQHFNQLSNISFWNLPCFNETDKEWLKEIITNYHSEQHIQKELTITNALQEEIIIDFMIIPIDISNANELVLLSSDITQRKKYEYQIKEGYTVFQNTHDGIVITDKNARIINVNKAFETYSGYSLEEVLYKNPNILKSDQHPPSFYTAFWNKLIQDGFWEGELINKKKNGEFWSEWLTINTVYDEKGDVQNYIGVFHDITLQKEHEKELKQKEDIIIQQSKMASMGEMIENIAHQWRQPLSVISTIATGIQLKHDYGMFDEQEVLNDLKSINISVQFLSQTIDDFRSFLTKTKIKKLFKLNEAVDKALNIMQSKFKNRGIHIITNLQELQSNGFENELVQVFLNLLSNSKDAFETRNIEQKYIFIDAYHENGQNIIIFKDSAGGIPNDIIEKVFNPYFTTKHQSQGTGIGLYMSKQIISNHLNGTLSVSNISFDYNYEILSGACFKIILND